MYIMHPNTDGICTCQEDCYDYLIKIKAVGRGRCEVFDDGAKGRGVRARTSITARTVACYYSRFVTEYLYEADKMYQYSNNRLWASCQNYEGKIEYGILLNDDLTLNPNCKVVSD